MKEKYDFLKATMMLEELGFSKVYLDDNDFFAIYYNYEIKALCSIEDYQGYLLCNFDSSYLTENVFTQDIKLLPGMVFLMKSRSIFTNSHNRKLPISTVHIISEKEIDEIIVRNRNIKNVNLDFNFFSKSYTDVHLSLMLKYISLTESEDKSLKYLKLSRLEQMPEEVKSMIEFQPYYQKKEGNALINRILRGK